jgi:hypothetical protein
MMMIRSPIGTWATSTLGLVICAAGLPVLAAFAAAPPASPEGISQLVRQLGSPKFAERERASRELVTLGIAAKDALTAAANDPDDAELRARARGLLAIVRESDFRNRLEAFSADFDGRRKQSLPGWQRFAALLGDSHQARRLFVEMARAEPDLLEAYAEGGKATDKVLDERCRELVEEFSQVSSREALFPLGTLASLLLIGSAEEVTVDEQLAAQLYTSMIYQPTFSKNARGGPWSAMLKKLLGLWIVKDSNPGATMHNLVFAASYDLKAEGLTVAGKILASETPTPQHRQFALLAIGRLGGKEHIETVEKFLSDETNCGAIQLTSPPRQIDVQVRDTALAVLIRLTDQRARDYGSVSAQSSPQSLFQVPALGFVDMAKRDAALKRWAAWRAEHAEP